MGTLGGNRNTSNGPLSTTPENVELQLKRDQMLDLRMQGKTLNEIGKQFDLDKSTVHYHIRNCLLEMMELRVEKTQELSQLQLSRYEKVLSVHWDKMLAGNVASAHVVLATLTRIDALLGIRQVRAPELDPPDPVGATVVHSAASKFEVARRLAWLLRQGVHVAQATIDSPPQPAH